MPWSEIFWTIPGLARFLPDTTVTKETRMATENTSHRDPVRNLMTPLTDDELVAPSEGARRNWGWMLALGIFLILGGLAALLLPFTATIAVTAAIGVIFFVGAVLQFIHVFRAGDWGARLWSGVSALVYLAGGVLLLLNPLAGMVALTVVAVAVFLIDGIVRIAMAVRMRPERGWGWVLTGGIGSAALAGLILALMPEISLTLLGVLAGVSLILEGWGCTFFALTAREAHRKMD